MLRSTLPRLSSSSRAIPSSQIPPLLLRLPPKPSSSKAPSSPTVSRLLANLHKRVARTSSTNQDGRGLGALKHVGLGEETDAIREEAEEDGRGLGKGLKAVAGEGEKNAMMALLPPNLRIEEFVPKRKEYAGVKSSHRDLLKRLRREA